MQLLSKDPGPAIMTPQEAAAQLKRALHASGAVPELQAAAERQHRLAVAAALAEQHAAIGVEHMATSMSFYPQASLYTAQQHQSVHAPLPQVHQQQHHLASAQQQQPAAQPTPLYELLQSSWLLKGQGSTAASIAAPLQHQQLQASASSRRTSHAAQHEAQTQQGQASTPTAAAAAAAVLASSGGSGPVNRDVLLAELQQDSFRGAVRQLLSEARGAGQPVNLMERLRSLVKRQIGGTLGSGRHLSMRLIRQFAITHAAGQWAG